MTSRICQHCGKEYQPTGTNQKYCTDCGPEMRRKQGLEYRAEYYQTHAEIERKRGREYMSRYAPVHVEQKHRYAAEHYKTHKKEHQEHQMNYYKNHTQQVIKRSLEYAKVHSDQRAISGEKRRALKYDNTPINELLTSTEWLAILAEANGHCVYCGREAKLTLDHVIPLSKSGKHSKDNVVAACGHCNSSKGNRTLEEWHAKGVGKLIVNALMVQCPISDTSKEVKQ